MFDMVPVGIRVKIKRVTIIYIHTYIFFTKKSEY